MKNKKNLIKLLSLSNSKHFYIKKKSKKYNKILQIRKFDPIIKKHFLYKEQKIN